MRRKERSPFDFTHDPFMLPFVTKRLSGRRNVAVVAATAAVVGGGAWVTKSTWGDWINMKCIQQNVAFCADSKFAKILLQHPPDQITSSLEKTKTVSGSPVKNLGTYTLVQGGIVAIQVPAKSPDGSVVQTPAYGVSARFSYNPGEFRKAFGSNFQDKNAKSFTVTDEVIAKQTTQNYIDYLRTDTTEPSAHRQACVQDMRGIVGEALQHSGWLLGSSSGAAGDVQASAITAERFASGENAYDIYPYLNVPDDPARTNVYAGYIKPAAAGKPTSYVIIDCSTAGGNQ